jgi:hypothetical protein
MRVVGVGTGRVAVGVGVVMAVVGLLVNTIYRYIKIPIWNALRLYMGIAAGILSISDFLFQSGATVRLPDDVVLVWG